MKNFKLSLAQKFSAILFLFVAISVDVLYLYIVAKNEPIEFGKQELSGNVYQRPLEKILQGLMKHRITAQRALYGVKQSAGELTDIQNSLTLAFNDLERVDKALAQDLKFTDEGLSSRKRDHFRFNNVSKEWADLKGKVLTLKPSESNEQHAHLIGDIRTMITHLGDTSNLILDPDLDSYYLMDITLLALPQTHDRIQNVIVELEPIVRKNEISNEDRIKASVFVSMMNESDLERIKGDFLTVLNEDPNFYGKSETLDSKLNPIHQDFAVKYKELINIVTDISNGKNTTPDKFIKASNEALASSFDYWHAAANELDLLLNKRVDYYLNAKTKSSVTSLLCLFLALGIAFIFMRSMIKHMRSIVTVLNQSSQEVSGASSQSASSATELSEASTEQAASLQETMATVEEISAMVNQNADSAFKTKNVVDSNQKVSENGSKSVGDMLLAIAEIKDTNDKILNQMEASNKEFAAIVKIISEIGQKTQVINEIVFQTKLLSFNASVEAARAGEHGKGFAVVAEEVGNLAQMSGNAAKEITEMLSSSIKKVNEIVDNTRVRVEQLVEIGKDKILMGQSTAQKCSESLSQITENAHTVAKMITEITQASKEQAQGIQEITKAISQLDQVTQQNSSVAQQSSSQAEQLHSEAFTLTQAVSQLVDFIDGSNHTPQVEAEPAHDKKVLHFKKNSPDKKTAAHKPEESFPKKSSLKKVVGGSPVPSSDDPNFDEF